MILVAWPTAALGHASPVSSDPVDGQVLAEAPEVLTVTFSESVSRARRGNLLLDAGGNTLPADFSVRDSVLTITPDEPLGTGTHVVTWRVVSADTHPIAGGFTFAVGAASAAPIEVPTAVAERELTVARTVVEALRYAGVLGLAGLVVFALFVAPPSVRRGGPAAARMHRTAVALGAFAVSGSLMVVPITAVWEAGDELSRVGGGRAWIEGATSAAGIAAVLALGGVASALVGLLRGRPVLAALGSALALASLAPVGHTRSHGPAWLVLTADLVHVTAGALWWGGLIGLAIVLSSRPRPRAAVRGAAIARFSSFAGVTLAALAVAGVALYWRIGNSFTGLLETDYGRAVLLKVLLLIPVMVAAAWNRRRLVPLLVGRDDRGADRLLRRTLVAELVLIAAVLVVTAVLVTRTPPERSGKVVSGVPTVQRVEIDLGATHRATVVVTPARRGTNAVQVSVTDADGNPVVGEEPPELKVALEAADLGPFARPLRAVAPGRWEGTVGFPLTGVWTVSLAVRVDQFEEPVASAEVEVP